MTQTTHTTGTTPSELIELQYDTWAYELKVWAQSRTVKRDTGIIRRFVEWLMIVK